MTPTTTVMWFRRDLRLSDNPALLEATRLGDRTVPLFVLDDALWGPAGDARRAFLSGCLRALDESLGGRLVLRHGKPEEVLPELVREIGARQAFAAADFGPYGSRRDGRTAAALCEAGASLELVGSPYAVPPGELRTRQGTPYRVFSAYAGAWRQHGWPPPLAAPRSPSWHRVEGDGVPGCPPVDAILPDPGEAAAKRAARRFWERRLAVYDNARDRPDLDATSRLSPYLKWGCLHPRQLLARLGRSSAEQAFRAELCWRDFYADVLHHDPSSGRQSMNVSLRDLEVDTGADADARFAAWAEGRTGYPLVDAGMRQLRAEAWMHNRVRMVAASFLVKDLHVDWRRGARYFLDRLVDGDLASNHHGWQWVAGTGTDAAPFVRVFNPVTQSRRFDPDGDYIRRYVPELRDVGATEIHEPWTVDSGPPHGYPAPMVDHGEERAEALRRLAAIR
jgi:deoxyribodipyrimidine photo-lyase